MSAATRSPVFRSLSGLGCWRSPVQLCEVPWATKGRPMGNESVATLQTDRIIMKSQVLLTETVANDVTFLSFRWKFQDPTIEVRYSTIEGRIQLRCSLT